MENKEVAMALMKGVIGLQNMIEEQKEKRIKKLWSPIDHSSTLKDFLGRLTVTDLKNIASYYKLSGLSALKKEQLIEVLFSEMGNRFENIFTDCLFLEEYKLIEKIAHAGGVINYINEDIDMVFHLRDLGIVFTGVINNRRILTIPSELRGSINGQLTNYNKNIVIGKDRWIKASRGILYYYGILEIHKLREFASKILKDEIDVIEFNKVMTQAEKNDKGLRKYEAYIYHNDVINPKDVLEEIERRNNIDFYSLNLEQILEAGETDYKPWERFRDNLYIFIKGRSDFYFEDVKEIVLDVVYKLKNGYKYTYLMNQLSQIVELRNINDANELARLLSELYDNLRLWELKGYTPNEIHNLTEKPRLNPLSKKAEGDVRKIGRNEQCPCGSGKKYKKCCLNK